MSGEPVMSNLAPILYAKDFNRAVSYFTEKLGFRKAWDWGKPPGFGCVARDGIELFICEGGQGQAGTWISIFMSGVDDYYEQVKAKGAKILKPLADESWGMREFQVETPDKHVLRFGQGQAEKDMKITRENVEVRLESRLAAVVRDFAAETRRSVGEVLEETLLHTFEELPGQEGRAVPSPHTRESQRRIKELKKKHGMDYDSHANYRFTEG